jgi:tRNA modification GTPase
MGIDRSQRAIADSDAILLIVDTSRPKSLKDEELKSKLEGLTCILVMNKSDLKTCWTLGEKERFAGRWPWLEVSAKTGAEIDRLRSKILEGLMGSSGNGLDGILVTNVRHCRCLENAKADIEHALASLQDGMSEEFALADLHKGLKELGEITGETQVEDLLGEIFSRFCIGK